MFILVSLCPNIEEFEAVRSSTPSLRRGTRSGTRRTRSSAVRKLLDLYVDLMSTTDGQDFTDDILIDVRDLTSLSELETLTLGMDCLIPRSDELSFGFNPQALPRSIRPVQFAVDFGGEISVLQQPLAPLAVPWCRLGFPASKRFNRLGLWAEGLMCEASVRTRPSGVKVMKGGGRGWSF